MSEHIRLSELHTHAFDDEKARTREGIIAQTVEVVISDSEMRTVPANPAPASGLPDGGWDGWMTVAGS